MALKGSLSKENVTKKILATFEGSFQYEKEIRIPMIENGEEIQLKLVLTCAKTNVAPGGDVATPGEINFGENSSKTISESEQINHIEPTQEEKDNISRLAKMLNL